MTKKIFVALLSLCLLLAALPAVGETAVQAAPFGQFDAENLRNEGRVTEDAFAQAEVTLVNYWATWCGPCVSELPYLGAIAEKTEGRAQVLGVLLDSMDSNGKRDDEAIEAMHALMDDADAHFDVVLPDAWLAAIATIVTSIPTTFIVDSDGNVIGSAIGSRTEAQWLEIIETAIAQR